MTFDLRMMLLGAGATAWLALAVLLVSSGVGLLVAFARLLPWRPLKALLAGVVVLVRGIPLLVLLLGGYFSLPYLGVDLPLYGVAVLVMGLYFAAYMSEVFRGAILSVPKGQWDAARSLGLGRLHLAFLVVLPQARRIALPPYLNTALSVVKNTSLVSAIGGWELAAAGREIGDRTGEFLPAYMAVAACYFLLCFPLSRLAARIEASRDVPKPLRTAR